MLALPWDFSCPYMYSSRMQLMNYLLWGMPEHVPIPLVFASLTSIAAQHTNLQRCRWRTFSRPTRSRGPPRLPPPCSSLSLRSLISGNQSKGRAALYGAAMASALTSGRRRRWPSEA